MRPALGPGVQPAIAASLFNERKRLNQLVRARRPRYLFYTSVSRGR
jgi:hypothetical protein